QTGKVMPKRGAEHRVRINKDQLYFGHASEPLFPGRTTGSALPLTSFRRPMAIPSASVLLLEDGQGQVSACATDEDPAGAFRAGAFHERTDLRPALPTERAEGA